MVGKSSLQEIAILAIIWENYQTLIWRLGDMVQNLESPGLSWKVDGTELTALYMYLPTLPSRGRGVHSLKEIDCVWLRFYLTPKLKETKILLQSFTAFHVDIFLYTTMANNIAIPS